MGSETNEGFFQKILERAGNNAAATGLLSVRGETLRDQNITKAKAGVARRLRRAAKSLGCDGDQEGRALGVRGNKIEALYLNFRSRVLPGAVEEMDVETLTRCPGS